MANLKWLYALLSGNTEIVSTSTNGSTSAETPAFENNNQEFMFDSLMDVPFEPVDILWPRL